MPTKPSPWQQHATRIIHQTSWLSLHEDQVTLPAGQPGVYSYIEVRPFTLVIPRDVEGHILLVEQWRYPLGRKLWGVPGGYIDDETPLQAGQRELGEEAGLQATLLVDLGSIDESPSVTNQTGLVLLAEGLIATPELFTTEDGITDSRWFTPTELAKLTNCQELTDSATLAALYRLHCYDLIGALAMASNA